RGMPYMSIDGPHAAHAVYRSGHDGYDRAGIFHEQRVPGLVSLGPQRQRIRLVGEVSGVAVADAHGHSAALQASILALLVGQQRLAGRKLTQEGGSTVP